MSTAAIAETRETRIDDRAAACDWTAVAAQLDGFGWAMNEALSEPGPHLIHMRIAPGSLAKLGRPTVKPSEVALRFRAFLASVSAGKAAAPA